jgi:hypothetical protein
MISELWLWQDIYKYFVAWAFLVVKYSTEYE